MCLNGWVCGILSYHASIHYCQLRFGLIIMFIKINIFRNFANPMFMEKYSVAPITRNPHTTNIARFIVYHNFDSYKSYLQHKCTNPVYTGCFLKWNNFCRIMYALFKRTMLIKNEFNLFLKCWFWQCRRQYRYVAMIGEGGHHNIQARRQKFSEGVRSIRQGVWGPFKAPRSPWVFGAKSCNLVISRHFIQTFGKPCFPLLSFKIFIKFYTN